MKYRNFSRLGLVWLLTFFLVHYLNAQEKQKVYKLPEQEVKEGFILLFDGTTMDQWIDPQNQYYIREGSICKKPNKNGNLYSKDEYTDFILRFEFQLYPGTNNGLGIRHKFFEGIRGYNGMEFQILDNDSPIYQNLKPAQYHGSLYNQVAAKKISLKPPGEWNEQEVYVKGTIVKIKVNKEDIFEFDLKKLPEEILEKRKFLSYKKGHIAFLGHDTEILFRHIRVKTL